MCGFWQKHYMSYGYLGLVCTVTNILIIYRGLLLSYAVMKWITYVVLEQNVTWVNEKKKLLGLLITVHVSTIGIVSELHPSMKISLFSRSPT